MIGFEKSLLNCHTVFHHPFLRCLWDGYDRSLSIHDYEFINFEAIFINLIREFFFYFYRFDVL